ASSGSTHRIPRATPPLMHAFAQLALGCTAIGAVYQVVAAGAVWRVLGRRRRRTPRPGGQLPPVTVLKPLKGADVRLSDNLATFSRPDYPAYQVVFGVDDPDDPAVAVIERLRHDFPAHDLVLSVGNVPGCNRKVANLVQMMRAARYDVLAVSDADIRV